MNRNSLRRSCPYDEEIAIPGGIRVLKGVFTFILALSFPIGGILLWYSFPKREQPGARYFILLTAAILLLNGGYIGELNSASLRQAMVWFYLEHIPLALHPYLWLMMCLDYNRIRVRRSVHCLLLLFPALYYFIFFTNGRLHLYTSQIRFVSNGYFKVLVSQKAIGFYLIIALITLIGLTCSFLYLRELYRSARMFRRSYLLLLFASVLPWSTIYMNTTNTNYLGIDYYPFFMILTGILYLFGIFQYNIFSNVPIAADMVYRYSEDAILLLDIDGFVTDANQTFLRYCPELAQLRQKCTLRDLMKNHPEFTHITRNHSEISFQKSHDDSLRYYQGRLTPIFSDTGVQIGQILTVKDQTLVVEYQNRLKFLAESATERAESNELSFLQAQISPHFINNTLSTIGAMISRDDKKARELVVDLSEYLINCYRPSESSITTLENELEAVHTYIRITKARFGNRIQYAENAEDLPDLKLPRLVLQPLVENAVRHGLLPKEEGGTVSLTVSREESCTRFEIRDNGVGIAPKRIATLLTGQNNRQGVGMINIHKRLLRYYGEGLGIKSDGRGTVVRFRIPITGNYEWEESRIDKDHSGG
ncbi:sensor histidine kinase [Caproicibacter sp.]|uniref:sensor histidine kinase n=1 Tax=Caproicibacter sp. TaxID=2814884 RepID=UPI003988FE77